MDLSTKPYKTLRLVHHYSLSEQPLTAFVKLGYGKRDFVKAEDRKTENREERQRGGGRVENYNPAKNGVTWQETEKKETRDNWLR